MDQSLLDPNFANEAPFNLPTDPATYPVFLDFGERYLHIRSELSTAYRDAVGEQLLEAMDADINLQERFNDEVEAWSRRNNFEDLEFKLFKKNRGDHDNDDSSDDGAVLESGSDEDEDENQKEGENQNTQMDYINQVREGDPERIRQAIRQAAHLPVPRISSITRNSIYNQPPIYHVPALIPSDETIDDFLPASDGFGPREPSNPSRSRPRTSSSMERSPERSPRLRRGSREESPESSRGQSRRRRRATRREEFPKEFAETRSERGSTTNSPHRNGHGGRGASSGSSHQENSPRERTPIFSREGGSSPLRSHSNSPGRANNSEGGMVVWSDCEESVNRKDPDIRNRYLNAMSSELRTALSGGGRRQTARRGRGDLQTARRGGRRSAGMRARSPDIAEVGWNSPGPRSQDQENELRMRAFAIVSRAERDRRMELLMRKLRITFVGEDAPSETFQPLQGDLIISHPDMGPNSRHIGLPNSVGYIASYLGEEYTFTECRDLVLRVGSFAELGHSRATSKPILSYSPFGSLELYAYEKISDPAWRFKGHQAELQNGIFRNPPDSSPGKFLRVGTPVLAPSSNFVQALVPRRGDVIIKREVWMREFSDARNFWYSMVKWHRGRSFSFLPGDMLVRRLVNNDRRNRSGGWAELYQYQGTSVGWVFWGRTQHVYDTPWPSKREACDILYEYDHGEDSDEEIRKESANPRKVFRERYQDEFSEDLLDDEFQDD